MTDDFLWVLSICVSSSEWVEVCSKEGTLSADQAFLEHSISTQLKGMASLQHLNLVLKMLLDTNAA